MTPFREPTLVDLLQDPIVQLVMKADGVTKADILELCAPHVSAADDIPPAYICSQLLESACRSEA